MKNTSATVVFFGNERLATGINTTAPTLRRLITAGYHVAAVVTNYEAGKSRSVRELEVAAVAAQHNIPVIINEKPSALISQLEAYKPDIGILVAYGQIVPQRVIDIFPRGIVNIHPSLLPLHRGPTPIESAILAGDTQTGVSLMRLVKAMDAGPYYAQTTIPLHGTETKPELTAALLTAGGNMLLQHLPDILSGSAVLIQQDDAQATYDQRLTKQDGVIDWSEPAVRIEREIRAFLEWPRSTTTLGTIPVIITKAHVIALSGTSGTPTLHHKQPVVYCGEQALSIDRVKPAGKKEMTGEAFLAGYKRLFT